MALPGYGVENQPVVLTGVTELLVHGVGGESAEDTLHEPHPMQVAGDATAGFYRGPDVDGRHRESYSWGGLTSGKASRALWLLLLPFALANLAGWMHWRRRDSREPGLFRSLIRLFGLSLTALGLLYVCSITFDLIAYQCAGDPALHRRPAALPAVVLAAAVDLAAECRLAGWAPAPAAGRGGRPAPGRGRAARLPGPQHPRTLRASQAKGRRHLRRRGRESPGHRRGGPRAGPAPGARGPVVLVRGAARPDAGAGPPGGGDRGHRLEPGRRVPGAGRRRPLGRSGASPGLDRAGHRRGGDVHAPATEADEEAALGPPGAALGRPCRPGPGRRRLLVPAGGRWRVVPLPARDQGGGRGRLR